ncbi:hypothetical protein [Sphingobium sp.]|uniref:hypothetical protein n=1 Tax=Sphingobium sp. TaxID=1912891 RepID=UPI0028BEDCE9|nr:hypothetical protein [Sphingobium sp.]
MTDGQDKLERRVTAGLRGASWNPELVSEDMRTSVHPLRTADDAPVIGYLHRKGGERTAVFIMHPRELLVTHYMVPHLVNAGYAVWTQGPRTVGNDLRLEHESAILDVAAGVVELKRLGFENVVMLGNSGGASLFAFYNQQAVAAPENRIARTPGGKPVKLAEAEMPVPDGFVFVAPHPGQGVLLMNMIDPSITDEDDPFSIDPALDPFSADNGFKDGKDSGASYPAEFLDRYRAAQRARVEKIDAKARALINIRMAARKQEAAGEPIESRYASTYSGIFEVWRTDADPRCFDTSLDSSDRRWGSVWGAKPVTSNVGSVGFARVCTPESWLSTWSALSSNASFDKAGPSITQPSLTIYYTGDNSVFPSDVARIQDAIAATDKQRIDIRGNHHGQSLRLDEESGQDIAARAIVGWLDAHFVEVPA